MSIHIPPGLTPMLQEFTIAVLRQKPDDLVKFASEYFNNLYQRQQKDGKKSKSKKSGAMGRISLPDSAQMDDDGSSKTSFNKLQLKLVLNLLDKIWQYNTYLGMNHTGGLKVWN